MTTNPDKGAVRAELEALRDWLAKCAEGGKPALWPVYRNGVLIGHATLQSVTVDPDEPQEVE